MSVSFVWYPAATYFPARGSHSAARSFSVADAPRTPCLTGSPVRFIVHRTRSQSIPSPALGCLTWPGNIYSSKTKEKHHALHDVLLWYPAATYFPARGSHSAARSFSVADAPRTPCLTGSPVRFIVHRTRSQSIPSPALGCLTWPGNIYSSKTKEKHHALHDVLLWYPAATYFPGPSPAKYLRRIRA